MGKTTDYKLCHILITGASSGLGAALALHYAEKGTLLFLAGRNEERLGNVAGQCQEKGAQVITGLFDVCEAEEAESWIKQCHAYAPLDLVIANAGISAGSDLAERANDMRIFRVNLDGVLNVFYPAAELMSAQGRGQIALMSSLAGYRGWPGAPAYCASKAAVKTFGESMRTPMARRGVKLNVICPGFIKTPLTDRNNFSMPFLMSAPRAAEIIARGLKRNKSRIAFPFPAVFVAWFFSVLPDSLAQCFLKHSPDKPLVAGQEDSSNCEN